VSILAGPKEAVYQLIQNIHSAWLRRKYREQFDEVKCFCLFVGYPRSGHSIVGALLNAHKDAVISHGLIVPPYVLRGCSRDELYARIIARAMWFNMRGNRANYSYQIPGQWQGRFQKLQVIGDKRGGETSLCIAEHPDFLQRVRDIVGVPLRLIHVVRNPFDNIAAISIWQHLSLRESIDHYFQHCRGTSLLSSLAQPGEVVTVRHEQMIRAPREVLAELCEFLGLASYPGYLDDCCNVIFKKPTFPRRKVNWPDNLLREIKQRIQELPFLADYQFEIAEEEFELTEGT
jgi:Sulfotransferase family